MITSATSVEQFSAHHLFDALCISLNTMARQALRKAILLHYDAVTEPWRTPTRSDSLSERATNALGWEVIEGHAHVTIILQARRGLGIFRFEPVQKGIERGVVCRSCRCYSDRTQHLLGFRVGPACVLSSTLADLCTPQRCCRVVE